MIFEHYPDVLTVAELQKALGIGRSMAYRLIREDRIRHLKIGGRIRIPRVSLVEYVKASCYNDSTVTDLPSQEAKEL